MGSAQLLLLIGSITILGLLSLQISESFSTRTDWELYNQSLITATGVAQSMIEEIRLKGYDERSIGKSLTKPDSLTAPALLGPDAGETFIALFDDVDDYSGYVRTDTFSILGAYKTDVVVQYVEKMNGDAISTSRTFSKRVDVAVSNAYLTDTVKLSCVFTY